MKEGGSKYLLKATQQVRSSAETGTHGGRTFALTHVIPTLFVATIATNTFTVIITTRQSSLSMQVMEELQRGEGPGQGHTAQEEHSLDWNFQHGTSSFVGEGSETWGPWSRRERRGRALGSQSQHCLLLARELRLATVCHWNCFLAGKMGVRKPCLGGGGGEGFRKPQVWK